MHYVLFVFITLVALFITATTRLPFILLPILYLFGLIYWKETKLARLKDFVEVKSKDWRSLKLDLDIEMRFDKEFILSWWVCGVFFNFYNFELRFILNGSHMDQFEIESGISTANLEEQTPNNLMMSGTSFDKGESTNLMDKYKFKTNKFRSVKKNCAEKVISDVANHEILTESQISPSSKDQENFVVIMDMESKELSEDNYQDIKTPENLEEEVVKSISHSDEENKGSVGHVS